MNKVAIFDKALKYQNITKKEFALKSNIPYDEVRKGNPKFLKPFFENLFYGDILKILPTKAIEKLLPSIQQLFKKETFLFWQNVVKMYKEGGIKNA